MDLSASACHFFGSHSPTHADFIALLNDGTYARIDREHMFTRISDQGEWEHYPTGEIALVSSGRFLDVESGPLHVFLWHRGRAEAREVLRLVRDFLDGTSAQSFSRERIESFFAFPAPVDPSIMLSHINIDFEREGPVLREEFLALAAELERYLENPEINVFRFTPRRYRDRVFLQLSNFGMPSQRTTDTILRDLEAAEEDATPPFIYLDLPLATFLQESGKLQPFVIYTEMNERLEAPRLPLLSEVSSSCS